MVFSLCFCHSKVELSHLDYNTLTKIIKWRNTYAPTPYNTASLDNAQESNIAEINGNLVVKKIKNPMKKLKQEEICAIILKYKDGATTYVLAEEYGVHRDTISRCLKKNGITPTRSRVNINEFTKQVSKLYEDGKNMTEIAKDLDVSRSMIQYHIVKAGIKTRTRWDY